MDSQQSDLRLNGSKDLSSDIFISDWPDWLRWGLMVPAALLGCLLVSMLFKLVMGFSPGGSEGNWRIWTDILQSILLGYSFVSIASYTAPKSQFTVSIIFLTIVCILSGMLIMAGLLYQTVTGDKLFLLLHSGLMIGGSFGAVLTIKSELN